jgi:hypothetical protein
MQVTFLLAAIAGGVALLRGGSLHSLASTHFRWRVLLYVGVGIQLVLEIWSPSWLTAQAATWATVGTTALVALFLLLNLKLPGLALAGIGLLLNVAVISANGAMPVSARAAEIAGVGGVVQDYGYRHERLTDDSVVPWLGDVIPVPPFGPVLSVGDVFLSLGIARLVYERTAASSRGRHRRKEAVNRADG